MHARRWPPTRRSSTGTRRHRSRRCTRPRAARARGSPPTSPSTPALTSRCCAPRPTPATSRSAGARRPACCARSPPHRAGRALADTHLFERTTRDRRWMHKRGARIEDHLAGQPGRRGAGQGLPGRRVRRARRRHRGAGRGRTASRSASSSRRSTPDRRWSPQAVKARWRRWATRRGALPAGSVLDRHGAFAVAAMATRRRRAQAGARLQRGDRGVRRGRGAGDGGLPIADDRDLAFSLAESAHRAWQGGPARAPTSPPRSTAACCSSRGRAAAHRSCAIRRRPGHAQLVVFSSGTAVVDDEPDPRDARVRRARARPLRRDAGAGARGRRALRRVAGGAARARDDCGDCARRGWR